MAAKKADGYLPLFETNAATGHTRIPFLSYVVSVSVGICFICVYRLSHTTTQPDEGKIFVGNWAWNGMFLAELWFIFYWVITLFVRWRPVHRYPFKDRLLNKYEKDLPGVDIFVCTADPILEPPIMVVNTVLSVMAYNYPPEKLSIYLSDDGGSELTFYALLEASRFSKVWLPFCNKLNIQPRSPNAYFRTPPQHLDDPLMAQELSYIKNIYEDMKNRVETAAKLGKIPDNIRQEHKGFSEWETVLSKRDHQTILQILIDGRDPTAMDIQGHPLPTLVYLSREKRPVYHHHFKAGALNALFDDHRNHDLNVYVWIRVSSRISNGSIILTVDCDMYSNNPDSVRDALCFFMDEEKSHDIAFVQFPQCFDNITKNDIYGTSLRAISEVELAGFDANGGPCYIGTGCFHRRDTLCGKKYSKETCKGDWIISSQNSRRKAEERASFLEETCKVLASCTYEQNTQWGQEMGLLYSSVVEDILTGLAIHCRGWRSIYFNPERKGFVGLPPTTLLQVLIQNKRWCEGDFQIFFSRYCPFLLGHNKMPLKLQFSYCIYLLWSVNCWATLYYLSVPSLCLLKGICLFPEVSNPWILAFVYVFTAACAYNFGEFLWSGGTVQGWWNEQRMWMFKRTTSYLFGFCNVMLTILGIAKSGFVVTAKVADEDGSQRYEQEVMEFGASSSMFTVLATLALLNLFALVICAKRVMMDAQTMKLEAFTPQILLCGLVVLINLPIYKGIFRKDKGSLPASVTYQSTAIAMVACSVALY